MSGIKTTRVSSFCEILSEAITDENRRPYSRGQIRDWPLLPPVYRKAEVKDGSTTPKQVELNHLSHFLSMAASLQNLSNMSEFAEKALGQHFGVPTDLLDLSQSLAVSTYFAVEDFRDPEAFCEVNGNKNGIIYLIRNNNNKIYSQKIYEDSTTMRPYESRESYIQRSRNVRTACELVIPQYIDTRMWLQSSVFLVCELQNQAIADDALIKILRQYNYTVEKLEIEPSNKKVIRDELEFIGVFEDKIFGDLPSIGRASRDMTYLP